MTNRSRRQQSKHDKALEGSVKYYVHKGFNVEADLKGFPKPKAINGRRPDLIAKKGKREIILEVETRDTIEADRQQQQVFRKYSGNSKDRQFRLKLAK